MSQAGSTVDFTVAPSATRTSAFTGSDIENMTGARGILLVLDLVSIAGTSPTIAVQLQMEDPTTKKYFTLYQTATQNTAGTYAFGYYPSALGTGGNLLTGAANGVLPRVFRVNTVHGGTVTSVNYSVGAVLVQ